MPLRILSMGKGSPISPVEEGRTRPGSMSRRKAVSRHVVSASRTPCAPVQALATPLLITTAWMRPRLIRLMPTITGAALTQLVVKSAAAVAGRSERMKAKSFLRLFLIPQATPANLNPGTLIVLIAVRARRSLTIFDFRLNRQPKIQNGGHFPQQRLYFFPLPQGQGSFLPTLLPWRFTGVARACASPSPP